MCPCPFCTTVAILLCPLLLFKGTRKWLKAKIKRHHCGCEVCQKAEHEQHMNNHTPCHCNACQAKTSAKANKRKTQKRAKRSPKTNRR